jgi:hypothetical protein
MTEVVVIPNCRCSHAVWRHVAERAACKSRACGCQSYRPKEQQP